MTSRPSHQKLAETLWDYHRLNHAPEKCDILFVLGSHDLRVADHAARLWLEGWAPLILFSGGIAHTGDLLKTTWNCSEAEMFAGRAIAAGVPEKVVILEKEATNTGENVQFSQRILKERKIPFTRIMAVQKPYMERRSYATLKKHWPHRKIILSSPPLSFKEYPNDEIKVDEVIHIMVGDLQRILEYPARGFQISQDVPENVLEAYRELVKIGYTRHMIREDH